MAAAATTSSTHAPRCRRCHRVLRNEKSIAAGYGPGCARIVRGETADFSPEQTAKAVRLIREGGVTRAKSKYGRLYLVTGTYQTYETDGLDCTCEGARFGGLCYHIEAARIAIARATRPVAA